MPHFWPTLFHFQVRRLYGTDRRTDRQDA